MSTKKLKTFTVSGELRLDVDILIEAETLEDAVIKGNALKVHDFIDFQGNAFIDGEHYIRGVYSSDQIFKKVK